VDEQARCLFSFKKSYGVGGEGLGEGAEVHDPWPPFSNTIHNSLKLKTEIWLWPHRMITLDTRDFLIKLKQLFLKSLYIRSTYFPTVW
jgi:hypothetical protein